MTLTIARAQLTDVKASNRSAPRPARGRKAPAPPLADATPFCRASAAVGGRIGAAVKQTGRTAWTENLLGEFRRQKQKSPERRTVRALEVRCREDLILQGVVDSSLVHARARTRLQRQRQQQARRAGPVTGAIMTSGDESRQYTSRVQAAATTNAGRAGAGTARRR